jgi:hypothetical protein
LRPIANWINGSDIADRSGVDTCETPLVKKFGPICAGSDGSRTWADALNCCTPGGFDSGARVGHADGYAADC